MKILTIAVAFPYPPDNGTKIQCFERIRQLSVRNDVTLLCISREPVPADAIREMERYCRCVVIPAAPFVGPRTTYAKAWQLVRSLWLRAPYYVRDRMSQEAVEWLEREVDARGIEVIEADADAGSYLMASVRALKVWIIHSVHDTTERRWLAGDNPAKRWSTRTYQILTHWYERRLFKGVDLFVTLTPENCRDLQRLHPNAHTRNCLSNGVDLEYFDYCPPAGVPQRVCFVGNMSYGPNVDAVLWFYREVFPRVRAELPNMRLSIIGGHPAEAIRALCDDPAVEVTGYVDDVRPHIRRSGLMVVPLRMGSGILNKLLQGLALGVPVVATSLALEGLAAVPNRDLLIGDSPEELAAAVMRLATDEAACAHLAASGRAYVEQHHQWDTMVRRYEAELEPLLRDRTAGQVSSGLTRVTRADA